jgi:hypothetical protein
MFAVGASRDLNRITGDWEVIQGDVDRAVASGLPFITGQYFYLFFKRGFSEK